MKFWKLIYAINLILITDHLSNSIYIHLLTCQQSCKPGSLLQHHPPPPTPHSNLPPPSPNPWSCVSVTVRASLMRGRRSAGSAAGLATASSGSAVLRDVEDLLYFRPGQSEQCSGGSGSQRECRKKAEPLISWIGYFHWICGFSWNPSVSDASFRFPFFLKCSSSLLYTRSTYS